MNREEIPNAIDKSMELRKNQMVKMEIKAKDKRAELPIKISALTDDERKVLAWLKASIEEKFGTLTVKIQDGKVVNIDWYNRDSKLAKAIDDLNSNIKT